MALFRQTYLFMTGLQCVDVIRNLIQTVYQIHFADCTLSRTIVVRTLLILYWHSDADTHFGFSTVTAGSSICNFVFDC